MVQALLTLPCSTKHSLATLLLLRMQLLSTLHRAFRLDLQRCSVQHHADTRLQVFNDMRKICNTVGQVTVCTLRHEYMMLRCRTLTASGESLPHFALCSSRCLTPFSRHGVCNGQAVVTAYVPRSQQHTERLPEQLMLQLLVTVPT